MAILTKSEFASIARTRASAMELKGIINEHRAFSKTNSVTSIFISHSHYDKEIVEQTKIFFENLGVKIYVDWADEAMSLKTNAITALKIKNQIINQNDKFILIATNNALASKWCNWELGIADPFKLENKKMALLPLADNEGTWNGAEYLQIYSRIEKSTLTRGDYYVWHPDGKLDLITDWLKR